MLLSNEYLDLFKAAAAPNLRIPALLWGRILSLWRDTGSENSLRAGWPHHVVCLGSVAIYVYYSNNYDSTSFTHKVSCKSNGHLPKGFLKAESPQNTCPETAPGEVQIFQCSLKQLSSIPSLSYPFPIQSCYCCTPDFVIVSDCFLYMPALLNNVMICYSYLMRGCF